MSISERYVEYKEDSSDIDIELIKAIEKIDNEYLKRRLLYLISLYERYFEDKYRDKIRDNMLIIGLLAIAMLVLILLFI